MRKFFIAFIGPVVFLGLVVLAAFKLPPFQDWLFSRLSKAVMTQPADKVDSLRVLVCGSASPLGMDPNRAQACIAVLTQDHFFIFDAGAGSNNRLQQAGLPLQRLDGIFLTHFHSDHIAALPDINLNTWVRGRPASMNIYGPAGVDSVVDGFNDAYRLDRQYRTLHHGADFMPEDLAVMTPLTIEPGVVWDGDGLKVTAFPVDHSPISPAVGYRVDYQGRSVVISGDTIVVDSLFEAAEGADLLFHDALSRPILEQMIESAETTGQHRLAHIMHDVIDYHADMAKIEARATAANVKQLVLYHMVPVPTNALFLAMFRRDLRDETILAEDFMTFDLPAGSDEIVRGAR